MAALTWDAPGEKFFEAGVDRGVLYLENLAGVPWSGLISVTENPTGGDPKPFYMDGIKYQNRAVPEEFSATLEAYTYPSLFSTCDGTLELQTGLFATQQRRKPFGLTYRTKIGNDLKGIDRGYKIHLIYNVLAAPTERGNQAIGESLEAMAFSWGLTTTPVQVDKARPTAHFIIDSTKTAPSVLTALENVLYGSPASQPLMPTITELVELFLSAVPDAPFEVTLLGDGVFRVSGSDKAVKILDSNHFQLSTPFVIDLQDGRYTATSGTSDGGSGGGEDVAFTVEDLGGGIFKITGSDTAVHMVDEYHFQLNVPFVVNNGNGTYTANSA
jgi:hypothetical protein